MIPGRRIAFEDLVRFDLERRTGAIRFIAGVDEAGRGALAGPVVAAAVICEPHDELRGVRDSKLLTARVREELSERIKSRAVSWGVGVVESADIDRINILRATLEAMRIAVASLDPRPCLILVDGTHLPQFEGRSEAIVGGDRRSFAIGAASILAKVTRDGLMRRYATVYRGYGFSRNKGYGTPEHRAAIGAMGRSELHRKSFRLHADGEGE